MEEGGKNRRCVYSDGDEEDLSLEALHELACKTNKRTEVRSTESNSYVDGSALKKQWSEMTDIELRDECKSLGISLRGIRKTSPKETYLRKLEAWKQSKDAI